MADAQGKPPSERDIRNFIRELDPDQFRTDPTSAVRTDTFDPTDFEEFVLEELGLAVERGARQIRGRATLVAGNQRRRFKQVADESPEQFVQRLHGEAMRIEAGWAFCTVRGAASVHGDEGQGRTPDPTRHRSPTSPTRIKAVNWFAQQRLAASGRHGALLPGMGEDGAMLIVEAPDGEGIWPGFRKIFGRLP